MSKKNFPLLFSFRQAVNRFEGDWREDKRVLQKKLQKTLPRLENEMRTELLLERLFRRFLHDRKRLGTDLTYRRHLVGRMKKQLKSVKFLWFDPRFSPDWKTRDSFGTTTPLKALLEGISSRTFQS